MKATAITLLLFLLISCEKEINDDIILLDKKIIPGFVVVKIKDDYKIDKVFEFINLFEYEAEITSKYYQSSLPPDSLDYVKDYIANKSYTNDGGNKYFLAYVDYRTNIINILPSLYYIRNNENQSDWLETMSILRLSEVTGNKQRTGTVKFHVPEGQEKECIEKFEEFDLVLWARFYYYVPINRNP